MTTDRLLCLQNIVKFDASVLRAFNPAHCFYYFHRNGEHGWKSLGAILLSFTGVEALFADLGAFSAKFVLPGCGLFFIRDPNN